jgi:hypothetical protein
MIGGSMLLDDQVQSCLKRADDAVNSEERKAWIALALVWLRIGAAEKQASKSSRRRLH